MEVRRLERASYHHALVLQVVFKVLLAFGFVFRIIQAEVSVLYQRLSL